MTNVDVKCAPLARKKAARGAAEKAAKMNPIAPLKAALKPVFKGMDLVSSSPLMPARLVQSFKAGVQDAGGVANYFKKQAVGDGNIIESVAEGVGFVAEVAQSGFSPEMLLDVLPGPGGWNKSRGKHHDEGSGEAGLYSRVPDEGKPQPWPAERRDPRFDYWGGPGESGKLKVTSGNLTAVMEKYSIALHSNVRLGINKSLRGFYGETRPIGRSARVDIAPQAFVNEEKLARTLYHENLHAGQLAGNG